MAITLLLLIAAVVLLWVKEFMGRNVLITGLLFLASLFALGSLGMEVQLNESLIEITEDFLDDKGNIYKSISRCDYEDFTKELSCVLDLQADSIRRTASFAKDYERLIGK